MSELQFSFKMSHHDPDLADTGLVILDFDNLHSTLHECCVSVNVFGFYNIDNYVMHDFFDFESRLIKELDSHKRFLYKLLSAADYSLLWMQQLFSLILPANKGATFNVGDVDFKRSVRRDTNNRIINCYHVEKRLYYSESLRELLNENITLINRLMSDKGLGQDSEYVWCGGYLPDIQKISAVTLSIELEKIKNNANKISTLKIVK